MQRALPAVVALQDVVERLHGVGPQRQPAHPEDLRQLLVQHTLSRDWHFFCYFLSRVVGAREVGGTGRYRDAYA